jgi:DNA polymerase I
VFDAKGKTFPRRLVSRIQGHAAADARRSGAQIEPLHETIARWAGRSLIVEGVEADDVIGTLAAPGRARARHARRSLPPATRISPSW